MIQPKQRPFAYAVVKHSRMQRVTPTLASVVLALAEISPQPSEAVEIVAWFGDGSYQKLRFSSLVTGDPPAWMSANDARRLEASLFPSGSTVRAQVAALIRKNPDCDYWEQIVLRFTEVLLAEVEEHLRGIPIEESGIEKWNEEDYFNLPDTIELVDGLPSPKRWNIAMEGRRRLGWMNHSEEFEFFANMNSEEVKAEYARRRAELRARLYVPSPIPFPSGREDE